ncbi:MAG: carbohydrate binding domain-containing protein [Sedimentisphaerales bacterium]|nr:carbohydrate binding domain-containing protein [Sedimentisphaerales bacterium]
MKQAMIRLVFFLVAFGFCNTIASGQENQIVNGEFDDDLNGWRYYGSAGFSLQVVQDAGLSGTNAIMIDVSDASAGTAIGFAQGGHNDENLELIQGQTYPIGFMAKAEQDREMIVLFQIYNPEIPQWLTPWDETVQLTTEPQSFSFEYLHEGESTADHSDWWVDIYFMLKGVWWPMEGDTLNKKVWIDQVYFGAKSLLQAKDPYPPDGSIYDDTWVGLGWTPIEFAVSHDVYLGDNFNDVNDGLGDTFRGNQFLTTYLVGFVGYAYPDGMVPGTTYYWRIDEVNDADPNSPWKGQVWSFTVPPRQAYAPDPPDGGTFIKTDAVLSWMPGLNVENHIVYFNNDFDDVNEATEGMSQDDTTYTPFLLEREETYYWRVDEFDGSTTHRGEVWSFRTVPDIPIHDPNLVGFWSLDEGSGSHAVDWSGHDNHGGFVGQPQWVDGYDGGGLELDGNSWVDCGTTATLRIAGPMTIACWVKPAALGGDQGFASLNGSYVFKVSDFNDSDNHLRFTTPGVLDHDAYNAVLNNGEWQHVAVAFEPNQAGGAVFYINADEADRLDASVMNEGSGPFLIGSNQWADQEFLGLIDDVRIYNKVLTAEEITEAMRDDLLLAWSPNPVNGSVPGVDEALPLSFSPGDMAAQNDVYFGTDRDAVANANTTTADIYRGRQNGTSYTPPEGVELGGGPYYWRIDEFNTDGTVSRGKIWKFTVKDYILIDDFENYDAGDNQVWFAWHDGLGYGSIGSDVYFAGNGTGSAVGDETTASYTEETIVHGGGRSMPLVYENDKLGYAYYSEVEHILTEQRDWTKEGVGELSIWFQGRPGSVGSFVEGPIGTYTMTGSGTDIWDVSGIGAGFHDEFHFAYKTLSGPGTIVAKVQSIENTNNWAKAGVMIRETLDADSVHAMMVVTPAEGVSFQRRNVTGDTSAADTTSGITAPYWVKLERDKVGNFVAYHSTNGSNWVMQGTPDNITMGTNVCIGLAVTSTDPALTCRAVFSNVTITGTVGTQWANQDIGIASNAAELLYAAVSDSTGTSAIVIHDDPAAAQIDTWTEWVIHLQAFADQGINLTDVDKIAIGLGTKGNITIPGGSGKMYFDDIRLYRTGNVP